MKDQGEEKKQTDLAILMGDVKAKEIAQHMGNHAGTMEVEIISLKESGNSFQYVSNTYSY